MPTSEFTYAKFLLQSLPMQNSYFRIYLSKIPTSEFTYAKFLATQFKYSDFLALIPELNLIGYHTPCLYRAPFNELLC
jgi:hypothetical protein